MIKKILDVLDYDFVQKYYNHNMKEAHSYAEKILDFLQNPKEIAALQRMSTIFHNLENSQLNDYQHLVQHVETREKCVEFLNQTDLVFIDLILTLKYIFRWVLPFKFYLRELIDKENETHKTNLEKLIRCKIRSSLDILEYCRTKDGTTKLAKEAGISETFIFDLVNRADISRLPYVRGKTVKHLCGGGYDSLQKLADADLEKMEKDMDAYYMTIGKRYADFKAIVPLYWMVGGARVLPKIVERSK